MVGHNPPSEWKPPVNSQPDTAMFARTFATCPHTEIGFNTGGHFEHLGQKNRSTQDTPLTCFISLSDPVLHLSFVVALAYWQKVQDKQQERTQFGFLSVFECLNFEHEMS